MITVNGYSKDSTIIPEGIAVTWGKDMIEEKGGLLSFIRYFESCMDTEDSLWLQKCKNKPKYEDLLYVYVIVSNQVKYRCFYGGYEKGSTEICDTAGDSWSSTKIITWPRILLFGPFEKAPFKIERRGFQGFRYTTKLF